jgi:hypothetical protein
MDPRHRVIEHGNVGLALLCLLDCLFAIARLCYDLPVGLPLDEPAQPGSYDLVVISDKYTYHGNGRLLEHAFDARIYSTGPDCFRTAAKPRKTQYTSEQYFRRELGLIFFAPGWDSVRSSQRLAAVRPPNLLFVVVKAGAHTPRPQGPAQPLRLEPRSGLTKKFRLRCCEPRETFLAMVAQRCIDGGPSGDACGAGGDKSHGDADGHQSNRKPRCLRRGFLLPRRARFMHSGAKREWKLSRLWLRRVRRP